MDYREALGQVLREIRVAAGLRREDCSAAVSREYLASVERGQRSVSIEKLHSLCECLGITPSLVLFAAEARLANSGLVEYRARQDQQIRAHMDAQRLRSTADTTAHEGVRGKRAELTRKSIQDLQAEGYTKTEVVRKLGVGRSTVDRNWMKADAT
ncbi:helix-turn-helix domain-containing protein [Pseudomonas syringae pv. syringae]|uniref:helix-turn-helix domain-containing protein n=1 Tax=Pseudomonas TaxID=286 RepID=UPI000CD316CD|nr:helix-turn-helix transcriptional regulator [Pseudomonas syringae]MCF4985162.1 helix-turn-helix domain-containing protein [Pseudomonas syringae]MCF5203387.1 helix-turn-helix domain-containing protein [Pseudomonas syringae]MCF5271582.1 helix-turn-helix domain-containing protein [Pseudomonas syringae]MCF5274445.1 helix-turn-helix domain-containing protein [Pseudomonas syringae]MCF5281654.1 helix-turn-helix domain-containing protein [Pseudomonas syringae]